jgi:hypothetical protein
MAVRCDERVDIAMISIAVDDVVVISKETAAGGILALASKKKFLPGATIAAMSS